MKGNEDLIRAVYRTAEGDVQALPRVGLSAGLVATSSEWG